MGYSALVEDVRIATGEVANDNERPPDQRKHVLDDRRVLPNVINSLAL
jgi:hypothetical protein